MRRKSFQPTTTTLLSRMLRNEDSKSTGRELAASLVDRKIKYMVRDTDYTFKGPMSSMKPKAFTELDSDDTKTNLESSLWLTNISKSVRRLQHRAERTCRWQLESALRSISRHCPHQSRVDVKSRSRHW